MIAPRLSRPATIFKNLTDIVRLFGMWVSCSQYCGISGIAGRDGSLGRPRASVESKRIFRLKAGHNALSCRQNGTNGAVTAECEDSKAKSPLQN